MSNVFWKDIFEGFQSIVFENKRSFMKKNALYTTTMIYCKARQVLHDIFSITKNGLEMTFVAGATNLTMTG